MVSPGKPPLVLFLAMILGILAVSVHGDSGGLHTRDGEIRLVTFYVA